MKIAFPFDGFPGGFLHSIKKSFEVIGEETFMYKPFKRGIINKGLRKVKISGISKYAVNDYEKAYNNYVIKQLSDYRPDVYFNFSGGELYPQTVKKIKENTNALLICLLGDNPCDANPVRDKYLAMALRFYDVILYPEKTWLKMLENISPNSQKIIFFGGYNPDLFYPIEINDDMSKMKDYLNCDLSFTGAGYGESAEGGYRASILGQLAEEGYKIKIWGSDKWKYRIKFYPELEHSIMGNRLSYEDLRILFRMSKIYLNMPSPQILTSFQPRVFEIAACKGFQIIDYSEELENIFGVNVPSFKSYKELKVQIKKYLNDEELRISIANSMHDIVVNDYTWAKQTSNMWSKIN